MEGWIKLYRKIRENKYWLEPRRFNKAEAWIDLLLKASYKDQEIVLGNLNLNLKAGQFVTSQLKLSELWKWDREMVNKFLLRLKNDRQITYKTSNKYTIITICNWNSYQNPDIEKPATNSTTEPAATPQQNRQQTDNKTDTINNEKNKKNDNNGKNKNKKRFFEFVLLTDDEYKKLLDKFGKQDAIRRIENLNNYIGSKGTKYKSHYHTILNWGSREHKKPQSILQEKDSFSTFKNADLDKLLIEKLGRIATKDMV